MQRSTNSSDSPEHRQVSQGKIRKNVKKGTVSNRSARLARTARDISAREKRLNKEHGKQGSQVT
ncbi:unnamed protein product [Tuber melanosporum]|uniref:(Perigord truffle) hypothetical protein n=1 Tax=Tuber melanosporum (strain Mel28) TaxID=656061 RepID=D5GIW4_TUBMM|nr:uncharacterized protein GSTUM_00008713001 [Tuber melanosporum]CAZ84457.1 unnamed protein product [Tuber melanosporum]